MSMRTRARNLMRRGGEPALGRLKLRAIDVAFRRFELRSLADLGAVWAVDAGYSLYALDSFGLDRVAICDDDFTEPVETRAAGDPRIELVPGNFGSSQSVDAVGTVDALIMFDILLHQVAPDWDELLQMYAPSARCVILAGPWWKSDATVRLVDLPREEYLDSVPLRELHEEIYEKLDEYNERRGRPWRDCHDIWQWGITDADLRRKMGELGFALAHYEIVGPWRGLDRFDDAAYVFVREAELATPRPVDIAPG